MLLVNRFEFNHDATLSVFNNLLNVFLLMFACTCSVTSLACPQAFPPFILLQKLDSGKAWDIHVIKWTRPFPPFFHTAKAGWWEGLGINDALSHTAYHHVMILEAYPQSSIPTIYHHHACCDFKKSLAHYIYTPSGSSHGKGVARANLRRRLYCCTTNVCAFKAIVWLARMHPMIRLSAGGEGAVPGELPGQRSTKEACCQNTMIMASCSDLRGLLCYVLHQVCELCIPPPLSTL